MQIVKLNYLDNILHLKGTILALTCSSSRAIIETGKEAEYKIARRATYGITSGRRDND